MILYTIDLIKMFCYHVAAVVVVVISGCYSSGLEDYIGLAVF